MAEYTTVARPYAEAIYQLAGEEKQVDGWAEILESLSVAVQAPEFEQLPLDPKVSKLQLVDLISSVVDGNQGVAPEEVKRFVMQLVSHGRLQALPEVLVQFQKMRDASSQVAEVKIYTAYALDDKQLAEILPTLEKRFGAKLRPQVEVDESLIGGICAVVGDDTLDMSIKARLEQMKSSLTA